ncbi:MAG: hypothetical protein Q9197_003278 [Variospora fuerteventurae]
MREPSSQIVEQWLELQLLFKAHPPNLVLGYHDFPGGRGAKPTPELLAGFLDMTLEQASYMREEHTSVLQGLPDYPQKVFAGRGITMIGGGRYSEFLATTLGMIRLIGSRLPVEVWMKDRSEEKAAWCDDLLTQGAVCRFISDYIADMSVFTNYYQLKVPVLLFSTFAEVLYLDSDSVPVVNPDAVFDAPLYIATGAVLWPDFWPSSESPYTPFITGRDSVKATAVPGFQTVEAGQMLWNKEKHWKGLCLSAYYNYFGPDYFYTLFTQGGHGWGDKDIFPTALRALGANWTLVAHHPQAQKYNDGTGTGHGVEIVTGTGAAMMQADPAHGEEFRSLFLHSVAVKLSPRRMLCTECFEDASALSAQERLEGKRVVFKGSIVDKGSTIHPPMRDGKRVFATKVEDELNDMGKLDTEKDIWRVMERVACVGAFNEEEICNRTRTHLEKTFGEVTRWYGGSEGRCR